MPDNLGQLLERRGTMEAAARDLSEFTGAPVDSCLRALREFYDADA